MNNATVSNKEIFEGIQVYSYEQIEKNKDSRYFEIEGLTATEFFNTLGSFKDLESAKKRWDQYVKIRADFHEELDPDLQHDLNLDHW